MKQWLILLACALVATILVALATHLLGLGSHDFAQPYLPAN